MSAWAADVIFWHVFPLGFTGAEPETVDDTRNRFDHLVDWLDYMVALGANGLLLGPIFKAATHGYDTLDHYAIDPRLGNLTDFTRLVSQARGRGIRVVLDGVFNHVSRDHAIVHAAFHGGPQSEAGRWIRWEGTYPRCFEGHEQLVELNLAHAPVADYVIDVLVHWLKMGADGWRLDAAYAAGPAVWYPILDHIKKSRPDAWFVAEVIHGDYAGFVAESAADSVTQYELWKSIWSSLNDANLFELDWTLQRHNELLETFLPHTFIGNHDVTRIATKLNDARHVGHATALLALLPGIPSIYSGDEQGFTGEKLDAVHGDDAVRPPFPQTPSGLLPFGAGMLELYQRLFGLRRRESWLTTSRVTTRDLENAYVVIELTGSEGQRLDLALNLTDAARRLPDGELVTSSDPTSPHVPAQGWTITRP